MLQLRQKIGVGRQILPSRAGVKRATRIDMNHYVQAHLDCKINTVRSTELLILCQTSKLSDEMITWLESIERVVVNCSVLFRV